MMYAKAAADAQRLASAYFWLYLFTATGCFFGLFAGLVWLPAFAGASAWLALLSQRRLSRLAMQLADLADTQVARVHPQHVDVP